jgi:hypothetical protein
MGKNIILDRRDANSCLNHVCDWKKHYYYCFRFSSGTNMQISLILGKYNIGR